MRGSLLFLATLIDLVVAIMLIPEFALADPVRLDPMGNVLNISPSAPPHGMNLMQILLENQSVSLKGTRCESGDGLSQNEIRTLQHRLALTLGYALDNKKHQAEITSWCKADKWELKLGLIVDTWHCNVNVVEKTKRGNYIANASIDFWVTKDNWTLIPASLTCM